MVSASRSVSRKLLKPWVLIAAGGLILLLAGFGLWQRQQAARQGTALPDPSATITESPVKPAEVRASSAAKYTVPADQPRSISLPSIGAEGFVQRVSLGKDNAVVAPTNVNFAGWYVSEAKPGDEGVSLIDGHVQGIYQPGIFKHLDKLQPGDTFSVEFGDRARRQFRVVSSRNYPVEEAGAHMLKQDPAIKRQLNLITCSGAYDKTKRQYDDRLLVVAERI